MVMEPTTIIFLIIALSIGFVLAYFLRPKQEGSDETGLKLILQQINELNRVVDSKIGESAKQMNESVRSQLGESAKLIREVTQGLTKLDETNRQVVSFADQLQNLQDILKNPKQRGILGEYYLETILKNVLPPGSYQMQYSFKDGTIVDAVVKVKDKIIAIDSKFSLENYNRIIEEKNPFEKERLEKLFKADLKMRIDETAKYVKPSEGTMDFALMFIPHEAIFYDLLVNQVGAIKVNTQDLIEYAFSKHVSIVSPTTFLAQLQTILQGLNALKIEESTKEIVKRIGMLQGHLLVYEDYIKKIGNHLGATVNAYNKAGQEFKKIDKDIVKIAGGELKINIDGVERPMLDE